MDLEAQRILAYLGLPIDYEPAPDAQPVAFLVRHLRELPPNLLRQFSAVTTPKQRSEVAAIRNRRLKFCDSDPEALRFHAARRAWPTLWDGSNARPGKEEAQEEMAWVDSEFMGGSLRPHVGRLGKLLGDFEEERAAVRARATRRVPLMADDFVPEEDESSGEEVSTEQTRPEPPDPEIEQALFLRRVKERFIYGLLETSLYDTVDWDDEWDFEDQDAEDRWFNDDE
ncbi:hypothetical protein K488DRAFT_47978 [Vararia minispora EC-137]|uniref:Uncharacterized protein n=1 Tax=Vararia minispora EC-137 TaxID=1314806 RepID=A0ACB8QNA7_9AGAM|nr:hypothetical protein K488DRAFT_47978 [Vararia minispora EC-137]